MPKYNYKKICEEFEEWLKNIMNLYKNCPELEKYTLRSKEYKRILRNYEVIKENYIEKEVKEMKNPYKLKTREWNEWEIRNDRLLREEKLLEDMTKYISEKILFVNKITYINENQLEVKICLNDLAKEYEAIYLDIDIKEFFEWREK